MCDISVIYLLYISFSTYSSDTQTRANETPETVKACGQIPGKLEETFVLF